MGALDEGNGMILQGGHKLIHCCGYPDFDGASEFYDLRCDPDELENLYTETNNVAQQMREQLQEVMGRDAAG